jgi:hypothetical protein
LKGDLRFRKGRDSVRRQLLFPFSDN